MPSTRRPVPISSLEEGLWDRGLRHIAGVDEAGRGALAGPVVAAAVVLPGGCMIDAADDSKKLGREARARLAPVIAERATSVAIGAANAREVDRLNVLRASHLAMRRAVGRLAVGAEHLLVDGRPVPSLGESHTAVVKGDGRVHSIACASILAKVVRDRLMRRLAGRHTGYGWETNVGYPTREHREALERLGTTPHHRRTFRPVQLALELEA